MEKAYDRRADSARARSLVLTCGEHPKTMEMFGLYSRLEHAYLDMMERAIRAECLLDEARKVLGKGAQHERNDGEAAVGDLRAGENSRA